jgi:hypothetical protein
VYETLERRATTLVLAAGIVIPLSSTLSSVGFPNSDVPPILVMVSLGLLAAALVLAIAALLPEERTDRLPLKTQLVFWAHVAFAAGMVVVAANGAYVAYRALTGGLSGF